jgi:hypothetical protein
VGSHIDKKHSGLLTMFDRLRRKRNLCIHSVLVFVSPGQYPPGETAGRTCMLIVDFENGDGFGGERQVYFAVSNRSGCIAVE